MKVDRDTGEILEDSPHVKELAVVLVEHLNGRTNEELSLELHQLIEAVTAHGKKGSLVVSIVVEPTSAVDGSPISIAFDSTLKAPKAAAPKALFFVDGDGNPVREDPRQLGLDFRIAPTPTTELRNA
jgi:hypothetical protein